MKTLIFSVAMMISMSVDAQGIYSPISVDSLAADEMYGNGVWYTDEYDGVFTCFVGKEEATVFLNDLAKDLDIDLKAPHGRANRVSIYKSAACNGMEVQWVKLTQGEQMLIVRLYVD